MNTPTVTPLGTSTANQAKPAPDTEAWSKRIYAMIEYGAADRGDPNNPLGLPPPLARLRGDTAEQIAEVQRDLDARLLPHIKGECHALIHNAGGNELDDSPRHMDLDQWADADEHGYGGVMPAIVAWLTMHRGNRRVQVYVGTVEDDLRHLIETGREPEAYARALKTILPLVHAGFGIGFDAAATYRWGSFGASIVELARSRGAIAWIEALPHPHRYQWQEVRGVGVSLRDSTWKKQMAYRRRDFGEEYPARLAQMPTIRWANERYSSRPENLDREIATVRGILEDGHSAAIPVGSILFQKFGPTARGVAEGVADA